MRTRNGSSSPLPPGLACGRSTPRDRPHSSLFVAAEPAMPVSRLKES